MSTLAELQAKARAEFGRDLDAYMAEWEESLRGGGKSAAADLATDPDSEGQWITIGGHEDEGEKHKGGFHVKIDKDGRIIAGGVAGLHGKKVNEVKGHFDALRDKRKGKEKGEADEGKSAEPGKETNEKAREETAPAKEESPAEPATPPEKSSSPAGDKPSPAGYNPVSGGESPRQEKAMSQVHGRTLKEGGKEVYLVRSGKGSASVGEVIRRKGQRYVITSARSSHVSEDDIEDRDAWSEYKDGPGWYTHITAVPVEDTEKEQRADAAEATQAKAQTDAAAAKKQAEEAAWSAVTGPGYQTIESSSPPPGLPEKLDWQLVSDNTDPKFGYGIKRYVATLPSGAKVGRSEYRSMDDAQTSYSVPENLADESHFERAVNLGRTLEENKRLAASDDYYKDEGQKLLDAYERATPERRATYEKAAASAARARSAPPEQQWPEVQRHYRDTGLMMDPTWMPDHAMKEYDRLRWGMDKELESRVPDQDVRNALQRSPWFGAAKKVAIYSGDKGAWESYLREAVPQAESTVSAGREAKRREWSDWYAANEPALREELAKVLPPELVSAGLSYVRSQTAEAAKPPTADRYKKPSAWAEDVRDQLKDEDGSFTPETHPELAAHGASLRAAAEEARKAARKAKPRETWHEVRGNTYPVKEKLKALGGRWRNGRWEIPASAASRLPRGLTSREI